MSFLPGLSLSGPVEEAPVQAAVPRIQDVEPNSEYRFEVAWNKSILLKLLSGTAEVFGTELAPNAKDPYTFLGGTKAAIYTWHGCRLEISGDCETEYTEEESQVPIYANVHLGVENLRIDAANNSSIGPRILVVGPENTGKTSLVKTLTAYAIKSGRQPITLSVDPRQGMLCVPGSFSAACFGSMLDVEEGWGSSPISGPSTVPVKMPLVYHYGLPAPEDGGKLFKPLITRMALAVTSRLEEDEEAKVSGCIIDTPGSLGKGGASADLIQHIVSEFSGPLPSVVIAFEPVSPFLIVVKLSIFVCHLLSKHVLILFIVNVLLVLGSGKLYQDMNKHLTTNRSVDDTPVAILKLDKPPGVVDLDEIYMQTLRSQQIRSYFFGHPSNTSLSPHTHWEDFSSLHIFRLIDTSTSSMNASFLPGADEEDDYAAGLKVGRDNIYEKITPSMAIQHTVLAVTHAGPNETEENIRDASVMGYVYVAEVEAAKQKVRLLSPLSGRVPSKALVLGNWPEEVVDLVG